LDRRLEGVVTGITGMIAVPPSASFAHTCSGLSCTFSSTSQPGTAPIDTYAWNFGDGTEAAGAQANHQFPAAGTFTVTLSVSDGEQASTFSQAISVSVPNVAPVADFSWSCADLVCTFVDASEDSDGSIASVSWDFGDSGTAAGSQVLHAFAAPGSYTVGLTVIDDDGGSATISKSVTATAANVAPAAAFTSTCTSLVCSFVSTSQDADGTITSTTWNFGDGATAAGAQAAHTFAAAGTYSVTVSVTDDRGAVASTTRTVSVQAPVEATVHGSFASATTVVSNKSKNPAAHSWNVTVVVEAHGADERPIRGATITASWTGAFTKTVSCVTSTTGRCTLKSASMSVLNPSVSLAITGVSAPPAVYDGSADHNAMGDANVVTSSVTFVKP